MRKMISMLSTIRALIGLPMEEISEYEYSNRGGSFVWKHSFSPALSSTVTGTISDYTFANTESYEISQAYNHQV